MPVNYGFSQYPSPALKTPYFFRLIIAANLLGLTVLLVFAFIISNRVQK